jgi:hypothetical protein
METATNKLIRLNPVRYPVHYGEHAAISTCPRLSNSLFDKRASLFTAALEIVDQHVIARPEVPVERWLPDARLFANGINTAEVRTFCVDDLVHCIIERSPDIWRQRSGHQTVAAATMASGLSR